jgi:hypothetical protein
MKLTCFQHKPSLPQAEALHELRENNVAGYERAVKAAQWRAWNMKLKAGAHTFSLNSVSGLVPKIW